MSTRSRVRKKPYTTIGIRRLACCRCGRKPSYASWHICADDNRTRPLCVSCDFMLNAMVMHWAFGLAAQPQIEAYRQKLIAKAGVQV